MAQRCSFDIRITQGLMLTMIKKTGFQPLIKLQVNAHTCEE